MNAQDHDTLGHYFCFVCTTLDDVVIWPSHMSEVTSTSISWKVHLKSNSSNVGSKHRHITTCYEHSAALFAWWVEIAQDEVDLAEATDAYMNRIEA